MTTTARKRTLIQGNASLDVLVLEGMRVMARGDRVTTEEACELVSAVLPVRSPYDPDLRAEPTPQTKKGMFRERGPTLLDQCIHLMGELYMESLNGVLYQVDDEHPRACDRCKRRWTELHGLIDRYDKGER